MSGLNLKDVKDFLIKVQKDKDRKSGNSQIAIDGDILQERKNVIDLKLVVGLDVSGSISMSQFKQFMTQLDRIKGLSVCLVIEIDTQICAMYNYERVHKSRIVRLSGGGGTEFTILWKKMKDLKPDALLLFTDGYVGDDGIDPGCPVGYIITANGVKPPYKFGRVVHKLPKEENEDD